MVTNFMVILPKPVMIIIPVGVNSGVAKELLNRNREVYYESDNRRYFAQDGKYYLATYKQDGTLEEVKEIK